MNASPTAPRRRRPATATAVPLPLPAADVAVEQLVDIPVDLLEPDPRNRDVGTAEEIGELAETIRQVGILQPITVGPAGTGPADGKPGHHPIVFGHRRRLAAMRAGLTTVPCIVKPHLVGPDARVVALIENLVRKGLNPIEEADAYAELMDQHGISQRELARRLGRKDPGDGRRQDSSRISRITSLRRLPPAVRRKVIDRTLPVVDAVELARVADKPKVCEELAGQAGRYPGAVRDAVRRELERRGEEKKLKETRDRLTRKGLRVVKAPTWGWQPSSDHQPLTDLERRGVDVAGHATLPCHAIAVHRGGNRAAGDTTEVCTSPAEHLGAKPAAVDKTDQAEQADARAIAHTRRLTLITALVQGGGKPVEEFVIRHAVALLLDSLDQDEQQLAAQMLYLDDTGTPEEITARIVDQAGRRGLPAHRALAAVVLLHLADLTRSAAEPTVRTSPAVHEHARALLGLLVEHGNYQPDPAERAILDDPAG